MPLAQYREQYWYPDESLAAGVLAHVFPRLSTSHAALYADQAGTTPLTNPLATDGTGFLTFWVENGDYLIYVNGQAYEAIVELDGITPHVWPAAFQWTQTVPAAVWTIPHGLDTRPSVLVVNGAGASLTGQIDYPDADTVTVTFASPVAGTAYLQR
jgi:hypothetical protein